MTKDSEDNTNQFIKVKNNHTKRVFFWCDYGQTYWKS